MTTDLATRAARIADQAAQRMSTAYIAREWWTVTRPDGTTVDVYFAPPQTQRDVLTSWYPGCGVTPCAR